MTRKDAQKAGVQGGGEVGADAQRKERERKSAREGRDFSDRRCPGSGRGGGEPGLKRRRPLSATPRTAGERLRPDPSEGAD